MKVMLAMKTHGQVAGHIDPQGHIVPLAVGGVALSQLVQDLPLGDDPEEVGFADFADGIDIIKLASTNASSTRASLRSNSMAADVDSAGSLILRSLATQLLDLIEHLQNLLVQHRDLGAGPTKAQILCTLLTQLR